MRTIQLKIPEDLDLNDYEILMFIASKLYEERKLSAGEAAQMAGVSKRTFIELLGKYGVSIFSDSVDDLYSDIKNA
jgi:predicted HTH domain antitoxin